MTGGRHDDAHGRLSRLCAIAEELTAENECLREDRDRLIADVKQLFIDREEARRIAESLQAAILSRTVAEGGRLDLVTAATALPWTE